MTVGLMPRAATRRCPRVLFVVNSLAAGGAERHLVELVSRGTVKRRFAADVVLLKSRRRELPNDLSPNLEKAGVTVRDGWFRWKYDPSAVVNLLRFVRQTRPDIMYTH